MTIALVLGLALILDAIVGEPRLLWDRLPHPAVLMGRAVTALDQALNRGQARRFKGAVAVLVLACAASGIGLMLSLAGPVGQVLCGAILLAQRSLVQHVGAVSAALQVSVPGGRQMVARIVSRNTDDMSTPDIARAAIESAAENLSDGVVAPAFWFLVGGLPGLLLYKMINTADSMIGYRNERYGAFGWAAARADDVLNLIPARLTALMIAALGGQLGTWRAITRDARRHRSPNAGWPEAAMARSLDIALAGPRTYDGHVQDLAWVNGDAERQIGPNDIDAAVSVLWRVWAMLLALTSAIALGSALTLG